MKHIEIRALPQQREQVITSYRPQYLLYPVSRSYSIIEFTPWRKFVKRTVDVFASSIGLVLLFPLFVYIAYRVRRSSPGSIFCTQERIGYKGKRFTIYKFRSMYPGAEPAGPALSSETDPRVTSWGRTMRKWRLDELPQLWNVLCGQMSLIGPRPEREYYINLIRQAAPEFTNLLELKPGLTSAGMVYFGYAENVSEMLHRMQYDLRYLNNLSLLLDVKILARTLRIILSGEGNDLLSVDRENFD